MAQAHNRGSKRRGTTISDSEIAAAVAIVFCATWAVLFMVPLFLFDKRPSTDDDAGRKAADEQNPN
jgi:MFS-type transporter involved in bile tolerance (Atg22 family)